MNHEDFARAQVDAFWRQELRLARRRRWIRQHPRRSRPLLRTFFMLDYEGPE